MATTYGLNCWKMLNHESAKLSIIYYLDYICNRIARKYRYGDGR